MQSSIWTRCAGSSEIRPLSGRALRMVEAQHRHSTLKLVDTVEEQEVLERLIEDSKPPPDPEAVERRLHYLLATPFRYPPLRHGSRYGRRSQRGLFYGARAARTVMAEVAYYRLWFLESTAADLAHLQTEHTLFRAPYRTRRGVDLTRPAFDSIREDLVSRRSYRVTHEIGDAMREEGVEVFRAPSARDPGGVVVGILRPRAFAATAPDRELQTWMCSTTRAQVVFRRSDLLDEEQVVFEREFFLVGGRLPDPPG